MIRQAQRWLLSANTTAVPARSDKPIPKNAPTCRRIQLRDPQAE
jgi:hypothetical protein